MRYYEFYFDYGGYYDIEDYPEDGGTEYQPVIVRAENPREAILKAAELVDLGGEYEGWSVSEYFYEVNGFDLRTRLKTLKSFDMDDFEEEEKLEVEAELRVKYAEEE